MAMRRLEFGDNLRGLLIDGIPDTPYVAAALGMTQDMGVTVEVPYLSSPNVAQFSQVQTWFSTKSPPSNVVLLTPEGTVSLFDIAWSGHSENWGGTRASVGTLRPALAVLGDRDGAIADPLLMGEMHSRLDGLNEWSRLSSVSTESETDDQSRVRSVTMFLHHDDGITWRQGSATLTIRAGWVHAPEQDGYDRKTIIEDNTHIESVFDAGPVPFWDHFSEHRKVANLMVFLFGRSLSFREHKLRDDRFVSRMMDGRVVGHPLTEIISRQTYRERRSEIPSKSKLGHPLAHLAQIGGDGLSTWAENYGAWERFILPSVNILSRTGRYIEDIVSSTSMSIEAAGGILGEQPGERVTWSRARKPTTATYVYRCLEVLGVKWPGPISDQVGLSRAIANNYNDVKHFDRGEFPNHDETYVVSEINQMIVRLMAIHLTGRGEDLLAPYREGNNLYELKQVVDAYGLHVDQDGCWHRDSYATDPS